MFIQKDSAGNVIGIANSMQYEVDGKPQAGWIDENVPDDHPDILAFNERLQTQQPTDEEVFRAAVTKKLGLTKGELAQAQASLSE